MTAPSATSTAIPNLPIPMERSMVEQLKNLRQFWALGSLSLERNREAALRDDRNVWVAWWDGPRQRQDHILGEKAALCGDPMNGGSWACRTVTPSAAILHPGVCDECVRHLVAVLEEAGNTVDASWRDAVRGREYILSLRQAG